MYIACAIVMSSKRNTQGNSPPATGDTQMAIYFPSSKNSSKNSSSKIETTIKTAVELSSKTDSKSIKTNAQLQDYLWK